MAQYLRQIGGAELTGSTRTMREGSQANTRLLIDRILGHGAPPVKTFALSQSIPPAPPRSTPARQ
jgi:hypothetical protein